MKIIKKKKRLITEMDSGMLGGTGVGGSVGNADSYAPGDNRIPRMFAPIQRRKNSKNITLSYLNDEDEEEKDNDVTDIQDLENKLDAALALHSPLIDLSKRDWNKITQMVGNENIDFFDAIKKYYRKKFGETIKIEQIDDFFNKFYAYGNRPLGN